MKLVYNRFIPFKGFCAMNLFGIIFVRKEYEGKIGAKTINHEAIHSAQMKELWYVPFYLIYFFEWIYRLITANGYDDISFEVEAYDNQNDLHYLEKRKPFAMWRNK